MRFTPPLIFLLGSLLTLWTVALSAQTLTPAGTIIRNQAVIEFERDDTTGITFRSTSNEVILEVAEVYGITITPDGTVLSPGQTQQAISTNPAQRVTYAYLLTFTGNTADQATITPTYANSDSDFAPRLSDGDNGFLVYNDLNFNGVVDSSDILVASWRDANADGILDSNEVASLNLGQSYQPDEAASLLVTFFVPNGQIAGAETYFGINGASTGDPTKTDTGNIGRTTVIDDAIMRVLKVADLEEAGPGDTITFTLRADSNGSEDARQLSWTVDSTTTYGVLLWDAIPTDEATGEPLPLAGAALDGLPTIGAGSETGIFIYAAPASIPASPDYATLNTWTWTETPATLGTAPTVIGFLSAGNTTAPIAAEDLAPGEFVEFSFSTTVPTEADEQILENIAYATYDTVALGNQTIRSVNVVRVEITGGVGVVIRDTDFEGSPPPLTSADDSVSDQQTISAAQAGNTLTFVNRVINTGVNTDTFNLSIDPSSTIPPGWTVTFFKSDGVTPLRDTGSDGIIDTGPLAPHGSNLANPAAFTDIVVAVTIPENAADDSGAPLMDIVVKATSLNNGGVSDTTSDRLLAVSRAGMNLANWDGAIEENVIQNITTPGGYTDFPLIVQNTVAADGEPDTYTLTVPTLPSGWRAVYYLDKDDDGIVDENELLPLAETPTIQPQEAERLIARLFIPGDEVIDSDLNGVADVFPITFRATSTNDPTLFDEQDDEVVLDWGNRFELRPDRQGTVEPGGTVTYLHTITNYSERALTIYFELESTQTSWRRALVAVGGAVELTQGTDPVDAQTKYTLSLDAAGGPNDSRQFLLRLFAPANTATGAVDVTTLTALGVLTASPTAYLDTEPLHSVVDVTIAARSDLVLMKSVSPPEGTAVNPGDVLTYSTTFFNKGTGSVSDVIIFDAIPAYTSYRLQSGAVTVSGYSGTYTFELSRDGGLTWTADNAGSGSDSTVTNVRAVFDSPIPSGVEGIYEFEVSVQ